MSGLNYPKLHNAMWPGLVGKGPDAEEPSIDLDTMLRLTSQAEIDGVRFDGVDLFLYDPHISIDISDDGLKALADKIAQLDLVVGSVVAPVWFDASAMGSEAEQSNFLTAIQKACRIASKMRELGIRKYGIVRIDSASSPTRWSESPGDNQRKIVRTFQKAADIADSFGERLAAEGEICWGGMHSWRHMLDLLEQVNRPNSLGFQADLAHTYLYLLGYNAPEHALLSEPYTEAQFWSAYQKMTDALRPWTFDFHVAQNDGTVKGSGSHDKTGRHCPADDPLGKLDIIRCSGYWLQGAASRGLRHICWDGCMFPNPKLLAPSTWTTILQTMIRVRQRHGWSGDEANP